ncbi:MAG TPA: hypothetical protein VF715_19520 [Thermoleophilaceae bacterium]|jgi:ABC-type Zn uptake system ZnuABC Zn-binding protein ZnuA
MAVVGGLRVIKVARRVAPLAAEAYRRWNQLSPEEKERYKARARQYAARGQDIGRQALLRAEQAQQQRKKRGR